MSVAASTAALRLAGWVGVGLLLALDMLMVLSIPFVLLVTVPLTVLALYQLEERPGPGMARWGMALGLAALPFFFAYTNRHGPGTWCHPIGTSQYPGTECDEQWDPRPFVVAGIALVLAAFVVPALMRLRRAVRRG